MIITVTNVSCAVSSVHIFQSECLHSYLWLRWAPACKSQPHYQSCATWLFWCWCWCCNANETKHATKQGIKRNPNVSMHSPGFSNLDTGNFVILMPFHICATCNVRNTLLTVRWWLKCNEKCEKIRLTLQFDTHGQCVVRCFVTWNLFNSVVLFCKVDDAISACETLKGREIETHRVIDEHQTGAIWKIFHCGGVNHKRVQSFSHHLMTCDFK